MTSFSPSRLCLESLEDRTLPSGVTNSLAQLPLAFEANVGQASASADFVARGPQYTLSLNGAGATLALQPAGNATPPETLTMSLLGANAAVRGTGLDPQAGVSNYLIGNDPGLWHTAVGHYGRVAYPNVAPGFDVSYYGNAGQLEYDLVLHPGVNPALVRLRFTGQRGLSFDGAGDLLVQLPQGELVEKAPVLYQDVGGVRHTVSGRYVLEGGGVVGLAVGSYNRGAALTIDPVLAYSTYLGGSGTDQANAIAVDGAGNMYVTGTTSSANFPTRNAFQGTLGTGGYQNAFVTKLNADGTLAYSTYLGGNNAASGGLDQGNGIAVDGAGDAYVTGNTGSTNFPLKHAWQPTFSGNYDAFVTKLNPNGTLGYSTYLGGNPANSGQGIAVDSAGNADVVGYTYSSNFPTVFALQGTLGGGQDAFVTQLNAAGAVSYSTFLGGSGTDVANGIAVDGAGNMYVTGYTTSINFPTLNPFEGSLRGNNVTNAFVTKLNADGTLGFSTYLGGNVADVGNGIAVDGAGNMYVTGLTLSTNFPTRNAFQGALGSQIGASNAFVTRLNADGTLGYSTYLGGSGINQGAILGVVGDSGQGIAVDSAGNTYVTGFANSTNFPTLSPLQSTSGGGQDAFVARLTASGALSYSTYLGGSSTDQGQGIAVDTFGNAYVAGYTSSINFPTDNPFQASNAGGNSDGFVTKVAVTPWHAVDVATGSDNSTRMLWEDAAGHVTTWSVTNSFQVTQGATFAPIPGWNPRAIAAGGNGLTWLLWNGPNSQMAVWQLNAAGALVRNINLGAYAGWTAIDVAVGSDNNARVLWTNTSGLTQVWTVPTVGQISAGPAYGPYAGWSARSIDAGADGLLRVLWDSTSGQAALWLFNSSDVSSGGMVFSGQVYGGATLSGPAPGWVAVDVAVGSDNKTRILWDNTLTGQAIVWTVDSGFAISAGPVYGGYPGFTARALAGAADGTLRLLWGDVNGVASEWLLGLNDASTGAANFGPF